MADELAPQRLCFLALPDRFKWTPLDQTLRDAIQSAGFRVASYDTSDPDWGRESAEVIARADCIIADVTDPNKDVFFLLGNAQASGKMTILISERARSDPFFRNFESLGLFLFYDP